MANQTILQEYLMSLGFKVDQKSVKTFENFEKRANKAVYTLAKGALGAGLAAETLVSTWARSMERLYYSSRLAESTGERLQAAAYGAKQIGISGEQMTSMITGVGRALRLNPGLNGLLHSLGVKVEGRDRADVLHDMIDALRKMPFYQAAQFANLFGIGPDDLLLLEEGQERMKAFEKQRNQMFVDAGVDQKAAIEAGKEYAQLMTEIKERVSVLASVTALALLPAMRDLAGVMNEVLKDWTKLVPRISKEGIGGFLGDLWDGLRVASGGKAAMGGMPSWAQPIKVIPPSGPGGGAGRGSLNSLTVGLPLGLRQHNPGNLVSWANTPIANGFANFGSDEDGLRAMAANLIGYQKYGATSLNKIISRWAPEYVNGKKANDTQAYIADVSKQTGFGATDLLNLNDPKVVSALMSAMIKHEQGTNPFSMGELDNAARNRLGLAPVQIQQTTTIIVHSNDPGSAAAQVASKQNGVNADLARNVGNVVVR